MSALISLARDVLWLFLPAIAANMAPVFAARYHLLPGLNRPLDGGNIWRNKRILGDHKTARGALIGIFAGTLIGLLQGQALIGLLQGFGALAGDAAKSFVKRRLSKPPGTSWSPWDQIDFILGAVLFTAPLHTYRLREIFAALVVIGAGSYLVSALGVVLRIKERI